MYQNERIQQIPVDLGILGHSVPSYSSPCLDSIPVTSGDCRVSCTGLYADVTQEVRDRTDEINEQFQRGEDTINVTLLELVRRDTEGQDLLNDYYETKRIENKQMSKYMAQYTTYKKSFMKNMMFDPSSLGLSMCHKLCL